MKWIISIFGLSLLASAAQSQETIQEDRLVNISTEKEQLQKKVFIRSEFFRVQSEGITLQGSSLAVGLYFARSETMSIGPRFHQSYSAKDGWSTLYTALNFDFTFALTGALLQNFEKTKLDGWEFMEFNQYNPGGLRMRVSLDQYYYNTLKGSIPLSGFGIEGAYEFPTSTDFSIEIGIGVDRISNPNTVLVPFRGYISFMDMF